MRRPSLPALALLAACLAPPLGAAPAVTDLTPDVGWDLQRVVIDGDGFDGADVSVTFDGRAAPVLSARRTRLEVRVPAGATTGEVVVTVDAASSAPVPFTVAAPFPFDDPSSLGMDRRSPVADDVWFTDRGGSREVGRLVIDAARAIERQRRSTHGDPVGLPRDAAGRFYFMSSTDSPFNRGNIYRQEPAGAKVLIATARDLAHPSTTARAIAVDDARSLAYVADARTGELRAVPYPSGPRSVLARGLSFNDPAGLEVLPGGDVLVTADSSLYRVAPSGARVTLASGLGRPAGIGLSEDGATVFVADLDGRVHEVDVGTGASTVLLSGLDEPRDVQPALDGGDPVLWVAERARLARHRRRRDSPRLVAIAFNHAAGTASADGLDLQQDREGRDVSWPEWDPAGGLNDPVAYVAGQRVTVKARFEAPPGVTSARIHAVNVSPGPPASLFPDLPEQAVTFTGGVSDGDPFGFVTFTPAPVDGVPDVVGLHEVSYRWADENGDLVGGASGPHPVYVLFGAPTMPWAGRRLSVRALDYAMEHAAGLTAGRAGIETALDRMTDDLHGSRGLVYDAPVSRYGNGSNTPFAMTQFLNRAIDARRGGSAGCYDFAKALVTFANVVGCGTRRGHVYTVGYLNTVQPAGGVPRNSPFRGRACFGPDDSHFADNRNKFSEHQFAVLSDDNRLDDDDLVWDASMQLNTTAPLDACPSSTFTPVHGLTLRDGYFALLVDESPCDVENVLNDCPSRRGAADACVTTRPSCADAPPSRGVGQFIQSFSIQ